MKRFLVRVTWLVVLGWLGSSRTVAADIEKDPLELISGSSRLTIDPQTGCIQHLVLGEKELIKTTDSLGPFRLHVPLPDFEAHMVEAYQTKPTIQNISNGFRFQYKALNGSHGPLTIKAEYTIVADGQGAFELQCRIRNNSTFKIPQVFFPWIGGFIRVDNDEDPLMFGNGSFQPWKQWKVRTPSTKVSFMNYLKRPSFIIQPFYPYNESGMGGGLMKWMDIGGKNRGTSLFSKDTGVKDQFMLISTKNYGEKTMDLAWYFYPFVEPQGSEWVSPVFVLYPHEGDWHHGVLKFKEFTEKAFTPVRSSPDKDLTIGSQTLWISRHYQDWRNIKYRFTDIPAIATEAFEAGFRQMMLARATALDFCLPQVLRKPLGSAAEFKQSIEQARKAGVNVTMFQTCRIIRPETIPRGQNKEEWWIKNISGQLMPANWTYDPEMIPVMPIYQMGSRSGYFACSGSKSWQKAYWDNLRMISQDWGIRGILFDQSCSLFGGLCFNPLHDHRPDGELECLEKILSQTKARLHEAYGDDAILVGEGLYDAATQWADYTWDWTPLEGEWNESFAPFHMAFPRARRCCKVADDKSLINKVFVSGYLFDLYLEDGLARLGNYPELTAYFGSIANFKKHFLKYLSQRDAYLNDMYVKSNLNDGVWARVHRSGDEALIMVTHQEGKKTSSDLMIDIEGMLGKGRKTVEVWSRTLEMQNTVSAEGHAELHLSIPEQDFVGIRIY